MLLYISESIFGELNLKLDLGNYQTNATRLNLVLFESSDFYFFELVIVYVEH